MRKISTVFFRKYEQIFDFASLSHTDPWARDPLTPKGPGRVEQPLDGGPSVQRYGPNTFEMRRFLKADIFDFLEKLLVFIMKSAWLNLPLANWMSFIKKIKYFNKSAKILHEG